MQTLLQRLNRVDEGEQEVLYCFDSSGTVLNFLDFNAN